MKSYEYINTYCTGCGLCHSIKNTELIKINGGFPNVALKENDSVHFYEQVCPIFYYHGKMEHDVWGYVKKAYVGYSSNKEIRFKAATGGALTELCIYLLESGSVDGIIHTTYDPDDSTKTISVISTTAEKVRERCGSRYSISVPLENIKQMLLPHKRYAFVGKPCDVMALRRYFSVNVEMSKSIQYLLSFFCAGEPSEDAQVNLLKKMNCKNEECASITYRGNGWPGYTTIIKKDGTIEQLEYKVAWGQYLGRSLRTVCRFCMDGTGDAADIVCADLWYLDENEKPDFSEHEGRNIIISRTDKGTMIIDDAISCGKITCESDFTEHMDVFHKYQPSQFQRKGTMKSMISAMKLCYRNTPQYSKEYLNRYAAHLDVKVKGKFFLGIIKRALKGKV
jgi:coenzyme F420 hydrogenase subunit beta